MMATPQGMMMTHAGPVMTSMNSGGIPVSMATGGYSMAQMQPQMVRITVVHVIMAFT